MSPEFQPVKGIRLKSGVSMNLLLADLPGPFWRAGASSERPPDYADGLEYLIADYCRQDPEDLIAWAREHPLNAEERFILEYNTSLDRANVLRPLPIRAEERVLEVGCGCGPVSQYLWNCCQTISVEASEARASAAANRLSRHTNPFDSALLCVDFYDLDGEAGFDWVIFNGVLEYAAVYSGEKELNPYVAMLRRAEKFLKPGGRCVVAIENRLGLKYFSGAPEDHYDKRAVGLEGYRSLNSKRAPIRTFSKPALSSLFAESGFGETNYLFPFPDYKFARIVISNDSASWLFAADRLIDVSPSWRSPRSYEFDEPSAFRSLVEDGLAAEFAPSFLAIAVKPGSPMTAKLTNLICYLPAKRNPEAAVGARFDLANDQVVRQRISGGILAKPAELPTHAPGNRLAKFAESVVSQDGMSSVQPLSPKPTLWETFRKHLCHSVDTPIRYQTALGSRFGDVFQKYLASLPFQPSGDWAAFVEKVGRDFVRGGFENESAGVINFLKLQGAFAENSLQSLSMQPWSMWAPDWVLENLFPLDGDDGVVLFDIEYVDPTACLPTPILVCRQLRMIQAKTSALGLSACWPWPTQQLKLEASRVQLPAFACELASAALWKNATKETIDREMWFWSKVAEIVECAMISTVVAPLTKAYETSHWLEQLSVEVATVASSNLAALTIVSDQEPPTADRQTAEATFREDLISKELLIQQLSAIAEERARALIASNSEADRLRASAASLTVELKIKEVALIEAHARGYQLEKISSERELSLASSTAEANRLRADASKLTVELKAKETSLLGVHAEMQQLTVVSSERKSALIQSKAEADLLRDQAEQRLQLLKTAEIKIHLLQTELTGVQVQLTGLHDGLKAKENVIQDLLRTCDERLQLINKLAFTGPQPVANTTKVVTYHMQGPLKKLKRFARLRFHAWLVKRATHPLGKLIQYSPRPMSFERFPSAPPPSQWPRLCIITPSYNQAVFLSRTMDSVLLQNYPNLAYGVQDGGSTDESASIITRRIAQLTHAESARDEGQADAIQKGFKKLYPGHNDIMAWLNSDDTLMPGSLEYVGRYFAQHPEVDVIYGHRVIIDESGQEVGRWFMPKHHKNTLPWFDLVPQETLFWRARCFEQIGGMDPSFHFAMDWDLLLRFEQAGFNIRRVPYFLGCFRVHTAQKTSTRIQTLGEQEMKRLRLRTHQREVAHWEIHQQLDAEIGRSARVAWLRRLGISR